MNNHHVHHCVVRVSLPVKLLEQNFPSHYHDAVEDHRSHIRQSRVFLRTLYVLIVPFNGAPKSKYVCMYVCMYYIRTWRLCFEVSIYNKIMNVCMYCV